MIEYNDSKIGRVKVLNVTEARANFAKMLGDEGSHYVITKNNKPLRVIVDYRVFERLKKISDSVPAEPVLKQEIKTSNEESYSQEVVVEESKLVKKKKEVNSSVKGIIETNLSLSQKKKNLPKQPQKTSVKPPEELLEELFVAPKQEMPTDHNIKLPEPDDFDFELENIDEISASQSQENATDVLKDFLVTKEIIDNNEDDYFTEGDGGGDDIVDFENQLEKLAEDNGFDFVEPTKEMLANEVKKDDSTTEYEIQETNIEKEIAQEEEKTEPISFDTKTEVIEKNNYQSKNQESIVENENLTPEQKEYFEKYKKLYEGYDAAAQNEIDETEEHEVVTKTSINEDDCSVDIDLDLSETEEPQKTEFHYAEPAPPLKQTYKTDSEGLPSLKDLLDDLETEQLFNENGTQKTDLNEDEIDDLINKIKHNEY